MANLLIKSPGFENQILELKMGVNSLGRSPGNDFPIEHATISARHCEIILREGEVLARDCDSTNGTFVAGRRIKEAALSAGQTLHLGDVELFVESTAVTIAIPKFDVPRPAPPVVLSDGGILCKRHPKARATYQCKHCRELLCDACVTRMRRKGGKILKLCSLCSHPVERLGGEAKKKRSLLDFLQKTVKLPFVRTRNTE